MIPACGMVILPQNPSTGNGQIPQFQVAVSAYTCRFLVQKTINGVLNQFTSANGAAARVFELLDSVPDIELEGGTTHPPKQSIRPALGAKDQYLDKGTDILTVRGKPPNIPGRETHR